MSTSYRIDQQQRFTCSQCGRCCHRFDVVVSQAEIDLYRRKGAASWFRESDGAEATADPFEPIPQMPGLQRIRKRDDRACGFLSPDNRCRIHEELGHDRKPLSCRMFPYSFHTAADGAVVTASFACPTIIANEGDSVTTPASRAAIDTLRKEWSATPQLPAAPLEFVTGRGMDTRTARVLRENLLLLLKRDAPDIRDNISAIANVLEDLTRPKVLSLADADFAEYVALTLPFAAAKAAVPARLPAGRIARLLQYGFIFMVTATRAMVERRGQSNLHKRIVSVRLLAHFHGLAPGIDRVDVTALKRGAVDINAADIRPIVFHYLRSTFETLGARRRPLLDEIAIACSHLNAACALAVMNADAAGRRVDRQVFIDALMESSDLAHAGGSQLFDWAAQKLAAGTAALRQLAVSGCPPIG